MCGEAVERHLVVAVLFNPVPTADVAYLLKVCIGSLLQHVRDLPVDVFAKLTADSLDLPKRC